MKRISNIQCQITKKGFTLISKAFKGFTLIEILVVISIIGILATLILARLGGVEKQGRDARRKSDLNQYRTALENYASKTNGVYPTGNSDAASGTGIFSSGGALGPYMGGFPKDPLNDNTNGYNYYYRPDANGLTWVLQGRIESEAAASWQICSSGKVGKLTSYTTSPDSTCDLP